MMGDLLEKYKFSKIYLNIASHSFYNILAEAETQSLHIENCNWNANEVSLAPNMQLNAIFLVLFPFFICKEFVVKT